MNTKRGFTLIELLAVIVVIALIMVITIPNVLETMDRAKKQSLVTFAKKAINEAQKIELENTLLNIPKDERTLKGVKGYNKYAGNIKINDRNGNPYYTIVVHNDKYCIYNKKENELTIDNVEKYRGIVNSFSFLLYIQYLSLCTTIV